MAYCKYNSEEELFKLVRGQKTKFDPKMVLYFALAKRPVLQKRIAVAFGITEG